MQDELAAILGRQVDLVERKAVERRILPDRVWEVVEKHVPAIFH